MGATKQTFDYALQFFSIVGGGSIAIAAILLGSMLRAIGNAKSLMNIGFITNILNINLGYLLILV